MAVAVGLGWTDNGVTPRFDQGYKAGGRPAEIAGVLFSDDFETGTVGLDPSKSNSAWSWGEGVFTEVSDERAYEGTKSLKLRFVGSANVDGSSADANAEQNFTLDKKYTELWIRYKLWVPLNYQQRDPFSGAGNNKGLINVWNSYNGYSATTSLHFMRSSEGESRIYSAWRVNGNFTRNMYDPTDLSADGTPADSPLGITFTDRGTWIDWVIHLKVSTNPIGFNDREGWDPINDNGVVQVWKNGSLILNIQNAHNYYGGTETDPGGAGDGWNAGYLFGYANTGFDEDTLLYIDDFSVAETAAGVGFSV